MRRKVLFFTCELPPLPGLPVTGGGLRVHGLAEGLKAAGHQVILSVPVDRAEAAGEPAAALREHAHDPRAMGPLIADARPDVLLFEQWGTATYLPDTDIPTVIDLHGALSLENAFRSGGDIASDALTKIETLARADLLICAGVYQRNYFLGWWVLAGADPRTARVEVIPVCLAPETPRRSKRKGARFVMSGIAWPWIDPFPGLEILARKVGEHRDASLDLYLGRPQVTLTGGEEKDEQARYAEIVERVSGIDRVTIHEPIDRDALLAEYRSCACAFDLCRRNPERELAFTTRTVEYLWSGVPVIYGDYGELAASIERYQAGFVVDPEDGKAIRAVVDRIFQEPTILDERSRNAQRLARERLTWDRAVLPLARFVETPVRRAAKRSLVAGFKAVVDGHWEKLHLEKVQKIEAEYREEKRDLLARVNALHDRIDELVKARDQEIKALQAQARQETRDRDKRIDLLVAEKEKEAARHAKEVRELGERIDQANRLFDERLWQASQEQNALQK